MMYDEYKTIYPNNPIHENIWKDLFWDALKKLKTRTCV
jgi:hypothetical protein